MTTTTPETGGNCSACGGDLIILPDHGLAICGRKWCDLCDYPVSIPDTHNV